MAWTNQLFGWRRRSKRSKRSKRGEADTTIAGPVVETLAQQLRNGRVTPVPYPRFRASAADQLDPRRQADLFEGMRMRLRSAFTPSQPVTDRRVFAGRTDVLDTLIRATEDLRLHSVLYGERGLGKTSVLHIFAQAARDARYLVIYVSCGAGSAFDEVFRSVTAHIPLLYCKGLQPTSPEVEQGKTFADILPTGPLSAQIISEVLANVVGTRVIIVLDEFDRCHSRDFRLGIAELLKNLSDRAVRVQLSIAGVAANLTELIEHIPSIQRNISALQLHRMAASEIRELIKNGETAAGLRFEESTVVGIVDVANGFPYFATLLSHYAGLRALDNQRSKVGFEDLLGAIRDAKEEFGCRLSQQTGAEVSRSIGAGQLQMLGALAGVAQMSGGSFEVRDIRSIFQKKDDVERCAQLVEELSESKTLLTLDKSQPSCFRFVDETAIPYIWLAAADERLQNAPGTTATMFSHT